MVEHRLSVGREMHVQVCAQHAVHAVCATKMHGTDTIINTDNKGQRSTTPPVGGQVVGAGRRGKWGNQHQHNTQSPSTDLNAPPKGKWGKRGWEGRQAAAASGGTRQAPPQQPTPGTNSNPLHCNCVHVSPPPSGLFNQSPPTAWAKGASGQVGRQGQVQPS